MVGLITRTMSAGRQNSDANDLLAARQTRSKWTIWCAGLLCVFVASECADYPKLYCAFIDDSEESIQILDLLG